jgi:hypothetical protein
MAGNRLAGLRGVPLPKSLRINSPGFAAPALWTYPRHYWLFAD